jgi:hypothetical protein
MVKVLSLGWGVQSFTLATMCALGELPMIDAAIHADTYHENHATYECAVQWTPWLEKHGVKIITVKNPTGGFWELIKRLGQTHIPAFTLNVHGDTGQLLRSCTHRWKIVPIRRWLQANRNGEPVEQWIGISTDEALRMKPSDVKYVTHRWPLIEKKMSRKDCINYLVGKDLEVPQKSSCIFCPYHNTREWQRIKANELDWREAIAVDEKLRKLRPPYDLFIHPSRKPLTLIDLRTQEQKGQIRLWDEECTGLCGV